MHPSSTLPHLKIDIDVNGTLIFLDSTKDAIREDYMIVCALAKSTFDTWQAGTEEMSYKEFVDKILFPGSRSDKALIESRKATIASFVDWLAETHHPLQQKVSESYQRIRRQFLDPQNGQLHFSVFPSFYTMIETLKKEDVPFTLVLRSFGNDLDCVVQEVKKPPHHLEINKRGFFQAGRLTIENASGERETIEKVEEIFDYFRSSTHLAIQDNWAEWNQNEEKADFGKPFFFSLENRQVLSLFFDDNVKGQGERDIVCPKPVCQAACSVQELIEKKLIFQVNTLEAMENPYYFVDKINEALAHHGFASLGEKR